MKKINILENIIKYSLVNHCKIKYECCSENRFAADVLTGI